MPLFTINKANVDIADGVYKVGLMDIRGPKTVLAQRGPNAGKEIDLYDWGFAVSEGEYEGTEIQASTSTNSGPRSKLYGFITALFGGVPPADGASFELSDLVGREALATIRTDESGWPRIDNLSALPKSMQVAPRTPTDTSAMVPNSDPDKVKYDARKVSPRRNAPAVEAPRFNGNGEIPATESDSLPF